MNNLEFVFTFLNVLTIFLIFVQKKSIRNSNFSEKFSQDLTNFNFLETVTTLSIILSLVFLIYNFVFKI